MDTNSRDCIHVNGIRAYGYTGFFPEEQVLGQWFAVDFIVWIDLSQAEQSDVLSHTYDYSKHITAIQTLIQTSKYRLIEKLASDIANLILTDDLVQQVQVRLTKLHPPIPNFDGQVTLEITRCRQQSIAD